MAKSSEPDTRIGPEERQALSVLAPVRVTLERIVKKSLEQAAGPGKPIPEAQLRMVVDAHWALVLEGFRRGVRLMQRGLHRGEGLDHTMIDQAVDFAMRDYLEETKPKGGA
jgi:hypothetical protein